MWTMEEIEAWGRNDIAALKGIEREPAGPARDPNTKSDDTWQEQWKSDVARKQAEDIARLRSGR